MSAALALPSPGDAAWRCADERRFQIRTALGNAAEWAARAAELIERAWVDRDDRTLDYSSWDAYAADVLAGIREVKIPVGPRQSLVGALRGAGMSARATAAAVGVDQRTVRTDLAAVGAAGDVVTGRDGKTYGATPRALPAAPGRTPSKVARAIAALKAVGPGGLTGPELARRLHVDRHGAGAILSELHATKGGARVRRLTDSRDGFAVYVLPSHVNGRDVEAPGRRPRRRLP